MLGRDGVGQLFLGMPRIGYIAMLMSVTQINVLKPSSELIHFTFSKSKLYFSFLMESLFDTPYFEVR